MNDKLALSLAFIAGAAAGAFVAWKALENKYKQIADDEIESVKDMFKRKMQKQKETNEQAALLKEYNDIVADEKYTNNKEDERDMAEKAKVYVIPPEDFGEYGFETVSLTYYADKVLVDSASNKVISNTDEIVGRNSLETFGEYEDDSVFVRNEDLKKDYEILLDVRKYSDIVSKKPHLLDDDDEQ